MRPRGLGAYLAPKRVKLPNAKVGATPARPMSQVSAKRLRFHPLGCSHGALPRCRQDLQYPSGAKEVLERRNPSRTDQQPTFHPCDRQCWQDQSATGESRDARSSSGSGIGQNCSPLSAVTFMNASLELGVVSHDRTCASSKSYNLCTRQSSDINDSIKFVL